ncbi:VapE domain-containing protein [Phaeobacter gallaeciensis]|nr:VapE domain-containing protein [Phaeobacter gallaeciensis]
MTDDVSLMPQLLHQAALQAGLVDTIPVMPPWADLHEHSRVDPAMRGKVPADYYGGLWDGMGNWPEYQMTMESAVKWDNLRANVGLKMGYQYAALDVDVTDELLAQVMRHHMDSISGGGWPVRIGQAPKALWIFRVSGEPIKRRQYPMKKEGVEGRQLIEVMGVSSKGRPTQAVIFGTHPSGSQYEWNMPLHVDSIPICTQEQMDNMVGALVEVAKTRGWEPKRATSPNTSDGTGSDLGAEPADVGLVREVVDLIPNDDLEYDDWVSIGYAIKGAMGATGWETFATFSDKAPKVVPATTAQMWNGFKPDGSAGMGKLVFLARQAQGGTLPNGLDDRIRSGALLKGAEKAGMPMVAPVVLQGIDPSYRPPPPVDDPEAHVQPEPPSDWIDLVANDKGEAYANMANAEAYLRNSDSWKECFAFDAFNGRMVILHPLPEDDNMQTPRLMTDADYRATHKWFQRRMWPKISKGDVIDAVDSVAESNVYEPVQDYLRAVKWDGVPRLDTWLVNYAGVDCGVDPAVINYNAQIGRKWLISAVARAMQPGCQADYALILEGLQGVGKSSLFGALCPDPDWFGDSLPDFHTKDASEYLHGKWIVELSELTNVLKSEVEDMRRFLTRKVENFRASYARLHEKHPRRVVFAGSTNRDDYLKDAEGERRFWITRCVMPLDVAGLAAIRDQLWAEAYAAYMSGENWYLDDHTEAYARNVQRMRVPKHEWERELALFLSDKHEVTVTMCCNAMQLSEYGKRNVRMEREVGIALRNIGWVSSGRQFTQQPYVGQSAFIRD